MLDLQGGESMAQCPAALGTQLLLYLHVCTGVCTACVLHEGIDSVCFVLYDMPSA